MITFELVIKNVSQESPEKAKLEKYVSRLTRLQVDVHNSLSDLYYLFFFCELELLIFHESIE